MSMIQKREIISKVLSPALRLWLRSQVDAVEELEFQISGRNRQILSGYIPNVFLRATRAVYQGLHLARVQLEGETIRINIGQVLKGKPLQLLEPLQVSGEICLEEADLNTSVSSSLLSNAFTDLFLMLLKTSGRSYPNTILENYRLSWHKIALNNGKFALEGVLTDAEGKKQPTTIRAGLELVNRQTLRLYSIEMEILPSMLPIALTELLIDLGSDVELEIVSLNAGNLFCCGRLIVRP
jgi:LmeA-like phospholipid-binding